MMCSKDYFFCSENAMQKVINTDPEAKDTPGGGGPGLYGQGTDGLQRFNRCCHVEPQGTEQHSRELLRSDLQKAVSTAGGLTNSRVTILGMKAGIYHSRCGTQINQYLHLMVVLHPSASVDTAKWKSRTILRAL